MLLDDPQLGLNPCMRLFKVERLYQEIRCTDVKSFKFFTGSGPSSDENDRNFLKTIILLQLSAELETIHSGHHDVEQDDVWKYVPRYFQAFLSVARAVDLHVTANKPAFQQPGT